MKEESLTNKVLITTSLMVLVGFVIVEVYGVPTIQKSYDCQVVEKAIDVPLRVKEECRKLRSLKI